MRNESEESFADHPYINDLEVIGDQLFSDLPPVDRRRLALRPSFEGRILGAARTGDLALAHQLIDELCALETEEALSRPAHLLAESNRESIIAYVEYRKGCHDSALSHLCLAIDAYAELTRDATWKCFVGRQVFLATHWIRVQLKRGEVDAAVTVSLGLLEYSEGRVAAWPIAQCSPGPHACNPHDAFVAARIRDVFELVATAQALAKHESSQFLDHARAHLTLDCDVYPRIHKWIDCKVAALMGDSNRLAREGLRYLSSNRSDGPACWDSVAVDVWQSAAGRGDGAATVLAASISAAVRPMRADSKILALISEKCAEGEKHRDGVPAI